MCLSLKGKGRVFLVHTTKEYRASTHTVPFILNLSTRKRWVIIFLHQSLYNRERITVSIEQEAGWAPVPVWTFCMTENISSLLGFKSQNVLSIASVSIHTTLSHFLYWPLTAQNVQSCNYCIFRCKPLCKVQRKIKHRWIGSPSVVLFWFYRDHTDNENGLLPTQPCSELSPNRLKHIKILHITSVEILWLKQITSGNLWYGAACFKLTLCP